jgi:hypothetical protein
VQIAQKTAVRLPCGLQRLGRGVDVWRPSGFHISTVADAVEEDFYRHLLHWRTPFLLINLFK